MEGKKVGRTAGQKAVWWVERKVVEMVEVMVVKKADDSAAWKAHCWVGCSVAHSAARTAASLEWCSAEWMAAC